MFPTEPHTTRSAPRTRPRRIASPRERLSSSETRLSRSIPFPARIRVKRAAGLHAQRWVGGRSPERHHGDARERILERAVGALRRVAIPFHESLGLAEFRARLLRTFG